MNESITCLEKSKSLKPDFLLNYFELARAWHHEGKDDKAITLLQQMEKLPDEMYDDRTVRVQGRQLLAKLR
jgi:hypothetical protein